MEASTWESRHPALLGRLAGVAGAAFVILALAPEARAALSTAPA